MSKDKTSKEEVKRLIEQDRANHPRAKRKKKRVEVSAGANRVKDPVGRRRVVVRQMPPGPEHPPLNGGRPRDAQRPGDAARA